MTLPTRGSHRCVVDGKPYRWMASGSYAQGYMQVTVQEDAPTPGRFVQVRVRGTILNDNPQPDQVRDWVHHVVRRARKAGWDPSSRDQMPRLDLTI